MQHGQNREAKKRHVIAVQKLRVDRAQCPSWVDAVEKVLVILAEL
jgi:hypothetical protein